MSASTRDSSSGDPTFQIGILFHDNIDLLRETLPRCLSALITGTRESFDVVLHADGPSPQIAAQLPELAASLMLDEVRVRYRRRALASGDGSNNGHRRFFPCRSPYLIVVEDDVIAFRTERSFDVLAACRELFEDHPEVPVISKVNDAGQWTWPLRGEGPPIGPGVRSVNRLSTHLIAYDVARFSQAARRFGAFDLDVFIDRDDLSYNWEDVVSHVGTTGGRRIAFPDAWPLDVYHCDRKREPGSIWHTQDPQVKAEVLTELVARYDHATVGGDGQ